MIVSERGAAWRPRGKGLAVASLLAGGAALLSGAFLPWATAQRGADTGIVTAVNAGLYGLIVVALALIVIGLGCVVLWRGVHPWIKFSAGIVAIGGLFVAWLMPAIAAVGATSQFSSDVRGDLATTSVTNDLGAYAVIIGAVLAMLGALGILTARRVPRDPTRSTV